LTVEGKAAGVAAVPVAVLAAEGVALGAVTVGPAAIVFDFSAGAGALTVAVGCPGAGDNGLTTTPVPPLVGEGMLLAGIVVPVFSFWVEIAPVGKALSFGCPEGRALTVTILLPEAGALAAGAGVPAGVGAGGVPPGFTVPVVTDCFSIVPAGAAAPIATPPGLKTVSIVLAVEPLVPLETGAAPAFGIGEEAPVEDLLTVAVGPLFTPPLWEDEVEALVPAFSPLGATTVSVA